MKYNIPPDSERHAARMGKRYETKRGLHPFDQLCHSCVMNECSDTNSKCLQRVVMQCERQFTRTSWERMSKAMVQAGLADLLGDDLIEEFGLEELAGKVKRRTLEEVQDEARKQGRFPIRKKAKA